MRTTTINIDGKDHLLCFSARVIDACTDRFGSMDNMTAVLNSGEKALKDTLWMLSAMMDAGQRYAARNGLENPAPISFDDLLDTFGIDDIQALSDAVGQTVAVGAAVTVEVEENPKNAETTGSN